MGIVDLYFLFNLTIILTHSRQNYYTLSSEIAFELALHLGSTLEAN